MHQSISKYSIVLLIALAFTAEQQLAAQETPGFTGEFHEARSNLIYLRHRNYDAETGSFLCKDPIGVTGGLNSYAYCRGNPVNNQDPLGLLTPADTAAAALVGGGIGLVGQGLGDFVFQRPVQWQNYVASAAGGATTAALLVNTFNPALAGAGGGAASNTVRQAANLVTGQQQSYSPASLATEVVVSGAFTMAGSTVGAMVKSGGQTTTLTIAATSRNAAPLSGSGAPFHVVYSAGDEAAHAVGQRFFQMETKAMSMNAFNSYLNQSYGSISIPVAAANSALVTQAGLPAASCASASVSAFARGWFSQSGSYLGFAAKVGLDPSGVLIDKAAELVGSNLADIKGATYDPVSNQIIFLGSNTTPGVEGIDMDYFYTAVQAVYGSAIPPYVSLDAPASAASLWQDLGDGDGNFEAQEWGGFTLRYNPLWAEVDSNVAVRVKCKIGATNYDFNVNFTPQTIDWLQYPNGQYPMHLVYSNITGTAPPGISVWDGPFTSLPYPQTVLDYVNTSSNTSGGQDWTYSFQLYNGGTGTITNISFAVIPDRQHRRFGGRLEGTKLGWVLQEADRIMKCLAIGKDNVTGANYTSATVPIAGFKNLAEINAAGTSVSGNTRVWFLADQMKLKRYVDPATGRATIVFDQAVVGVKTESALNFQAQSPGVAAFASHLQTNFDAFAARSFPVVSPDDPTGQTVINVKIFKMLKDAMQAVSLARFFRDNNIPLDMWWMNSWKAPTAYSPKSVATITNSSLGIVLYGGVDNRKVNTYTPSTSAQSVGTAIASARPNTPVNPTEDIKEQAWTASTVEGTVKAMAASVESSPFWLLYGMACFIAIFEIVSFNLAQKLECLKQQGPPLESRSLPSLIAMLSGFCQLGRSAENHCLKVWPL